MEAQKANYEGEIGTELLSQLTKDEQKECETIQVFSWNLYIYKFVYFSMICGKRRVSWKK